MERLATRAKRGMALARQRPGEADFYLDSVALSLHDFYTGLERAFRQIAAVVDESVPAGPNWHEELARQMAAECPQVRPAVVSSKSLEALDEYLRFRHVVRNVYAFEFDAERLGRLVEALDPTFGQVRSELQAFADFLERLAQ